MLEGHGDKSSDEILFEFIKRSAEKMVEDNITDDVDKVMKKYMLIKDEVESDFDEIVKRAKKVQAAVENRESRIKKEMERHLEEMKEQNEIREMKIAAAKRVRQVRRK